MAWRIYSNIIEFLTTVFTWWNQAGVGTRLYTLYSGEYVGTDMDGNKYYQSQGRNKRWVIYSSEAEASSVPPGRYSWLHHTRCVPPDEDSCVISGKMRVNRTGDKTAHRVPGSLYRENSAQHMNGHYSPWIPSETLFTDE